MVIRYKSFLTRYSIPKVNGGRIFILGNGPSLKDNLENHIELLKNSDTFCVNAFCLSEYFSIVKPKFYIFLDPAYFRKENTAERFIELQNNVLEKLNNNVSWNMKLFIPIKTDMKKEWEKLCDNNFNIEIVYFNNNSAHGFNQICHFLFKKNLAMPEPQNVLVGAIYISINMRYKDIYLLGADHSWTQDLKVNDKNQLCIVVNHFNSSEERLYYKVDGTIWKIGEVLVALSKTFNSYISLQKYSKYEEISIFNLTSNSFIDAFKKEKIEDIYNDRNS